MTPDVKPTSGFAVRAHVAGGTGYIHRNGYFAGVEDAWIMTRAEAEAEARRLSRRTDFGEDNPEIVEMRDGQPVDGTGVRLADLPEEPDLVALARDIRELPPVVGAELLRTMLRDGAMALRDFVDPRDGTPLQLKAFEFSRPPGKVKPK